MFSFKKGIFLVFLLILGMGKINFLMAQPNTYIRIDNNDKPKKYQTKILPIEKSNDQEIESGKGELHGWKKFIQGTYSHYNFLFNANNKLNWALQTAQSQQIDDYTQLLPYDNYNLKDLSRNAYLDTAIEKANGSLLLHDIRNQWNDEVYLILGKSFYYKMMWDSATIHFQYLNYAFAPKDDGYDIPIGSNISNKEQKLTIASEKPKGFLKHNPRRNEGLIWLAKSLIMNGDIITGKSILDLLYIDSNFPKYLIPQLNDCNARAFYYLKKYDSAAYYMDASFAVAADNLDKSRRKYLAGQLWQLADNKDKAKEDFEYSASHSPNILMEIYSLLLLSDMDSDGNNQEKQLNRLLTLSKKGKYKDYRDLIFYQMGNKYLQQTDTTNALKYFLLSTKNNANNNSNWSYRSFQKMGDIAENRFEFNELVRNYDSIKGNFGNDKDWPQFSQRKTAISELSKPLIEINQSDSVLALVALPESVQEKILKAKLRQIRKMLGLKDQDNTPSSPLFNTNNNMPDLFSGVSNKSGQWYFNNNEVRSQGYQNFIAQYGVRPNVDNWIRQSAIQLNVNQQTNGTQDNNTVSQHVDLSQITLKSLKDQLPNTPEKQSEIKQKIADNYLLAGKIMENKLYNYPAAQWFYKQSANIDPAYLKNKEEILYHLATSYYENGDKKAAKTLHDQLAKEFPNSRFLKSALKKENSISSEATEPGKMYANIYNEMISGDFGKAKQDKQKADSIYGNQYWTPQLLYIESIYHVSERQDSTAIQKLGTLIYMFPNSKIRPLAETMRSVVSRRKEIETYLTNLKITRLQDTEEEFVRKGINEHYDATLKEKGPIVFKDSVRTPIKNDIALKIPKLVIQKADTVSKNGIPPYIIAVDSPHYVMLLLDKVARVFATETGNAFNRFNKQNYRQLSQPARLQPLDDRYQLVLIGPFKDAGDAYIYIDKVSPITPVRILPWLAKDKFSFSMISDRNLNILLQYKNLDDYKAKLHETLPGKF